MFGVTDPGALSINGLVAGADEAPATEVVLLGGVEPEGGFIINGLDVAFELFCGFRKGFVAI